MLHLKLALLAAAGGAAGSALRYLVGVLAARYFGTAFPWGTFAVNVAGCFLMGVVAGLAIARAPLSAEMRVFLATGFLGGFTTFSAFALDSCILYEKSPVTAAVYVFASVAVSLGAFLCGMLAVKLLS